LCPPKNYPSTKAHYKTSLKDIDLLALLELVMLTTPKYNNNTIKP
jgi:hypothetical protein